MGIEVLDSIVEIEAMRAEWDALELTAETPSIFRSADYVLASHRWFTPDTDLRVVTVRDDEGRLEAVVPLCVSHRSRSLERVLQPVATVDVDRLRMTAAAGTATQMWRLVLPTITSLGWETWAMNEVVDGPGLLSVLEETGQLDSRSFEVDILDSDQAFLVDVTGTWDEFLARHKSFRRRLRRFEREIPDHAIDVYDDPASVSKGLELYEQIEERSWKRGLGLTKSPAVRGFYHDIVSRLAADGRSSVRILRTGPDLIAADITHVFGPRAFLHSAVYSDDFAEHSPGTVFTGLVLKDMMESAPSIRDADFLTGMAPYAEPWATEVVSTKRVRVRRRNHRTLALDGLRAAKRAARWRPG